MAYIRKKNRMIAQINIVPLLDILLVLLIIFMITSQVAQNEVELNLPHANTKKVGAVTDNNVINIYINNQQEIIVNNEKIANLQNLETFFSLLPSDTQKENIILASDLNVPYQKIIEVLVALNNVGFTKIKMAYQNK